MKKRKLCNICDGSIFKAIYRLKDFNIIQCQKCNTLCRDVVFERNESEQLYKEDYFCDLQNDFFFKNKELREKAFESKIAIINKFYPQSGKLLDIGCATGTFLKVARQNGWDVEGVEISEFASNYSIEKEGLKIYNCDLMDVKLPSCSVDAVTMWDMIDHSEFPSEIIKEVNRILKPAGIIAMDTFMEDSLLITLANYAYRFSFGLIRYPACKAHPLHHSHYFSTKTFRYLLESNNFEVIFKKGSNLDARIVSLGFFGKIIVFFVNLLTKVIGRELEMLIVGRKKLNV